MDEKNQIQWLENCINRQKICLWHMKMGMAIMILAGYLALVGIFLGFIWFQERSFYWIFFICFMICFISGLLRFTKYDNMCDKEKLEYERIERGRGGSPI